MGKRCKPFAYDDIIVDDIEDEGGKKEEEWSRYLSSPESGVISLKFTLFSYSLHLSYTAN